MDKFIDKIEHSDGKKLTSPSGSESLVHISMESHGIQSNGERDAAYEEMRGKS